MKKTRIFQIILILAIFVVAITYYVGAASGSYSLRATGDALISSSNKEDIIDVAYFKENSILSIRYDLLLGGEEVYEAYNLSVDLLDSDGNKLEWSNYPYLYYSYDGYFGSDVNFYIDYNKLLDSNKVDILNNFKLKFYNVLYEEEKDDGAPPDIMAITEIETRSIKLYENGSLCKPTIDGDTANIGDILFIPVDNQFTSFSEINFESFNSETNTYEASMHLSLGSREVLKNYVYDVTLLSEEFPYRNILANSGISIVANESNPNEKLIEVYSGNTINNPDTTNTTDQTTNLGGRKFLVVEIGRFGTTRKVNNEKYKYTITLKTFKGEEIKIDLTITLDYEEELQGTSMTIASLKEDSYNLRHLSLSGSFVEKFWLNYMPYRTTVVKGETLIEEVENDFSSYWSSGKFLESGSIEINLGVLEAGFYTINTYDYYGNDVNFDENDNPIAPDESDSYWKITSKETFYMEKPSIDFRVVSGGENITFDNENEATIDFYTNANKANTLFGIYASTYNKNLNEISYSKNIEFSLVEDLETMEEPPTSSFKEIDGTNLISIGDNYNKDSFYILVYPDCGGSYEAYKINLNKIYYEEFVLSFTNGEVIDITTPTGDKPEESFPLLINLIVGGVEKDIKDYNHSYKILNLDETESSNSNIYVVKGEDSSAGDNLDRVYYNEFSSGRYLIRCQLDDYPNVYADIEVNISYSQSDETHTYTIEFLNEDTNVAVPDDASKENRIPIKTRVLRDGVVSNITPTFTVSGDEKVLIRDDTLIIKGGDATSRIGKGVVVKASLKEDSGEELASKDQTFVLVKQNSTNSGNIVDGSDSGGSSGGDNQDNTYKAPSKVDIYYNGNLQKKDIEYALTSASRDSISLQYVCYDEEDKIISNPKISINVTFDDASGTTIVKDYPNNEVRIFFNGIYSNRKATIEFISNGKVINSIGITIYCSSNFETTLEFVQSTFTRGGKMEAKATIVNNTLLDVNVLLVIACYDKNDKMVAFAQTPLVVKPDNRKPDKETGLLPDPPTITAKIALPYDLTDIVVKTFLLEGTSIDDANGYFRHPIVMTNREVE